MVMMKCLSKGFTYQIQTDQLVIKNYRRDWGVQTHIQTCRKLHWLKTIYLHHLVQGRIKINNMSVLRGKCFLFFSACLLALSTVGGSRSGLVIPFMWNSAASSGERELFIGMDFIVYNFKCLYSHFFVFQGHYEIYINRLSRYKCLKSNISHAKL